MNIFVEEHLDFIKCFLKNKVKFLLIGGYAVIAHGYRRTTGDMDLWLEPTNGNKILFINAIKELGFENESLDYLEKLDFSQAQVISFGEEPERIDFLTKINQVEFYQAFENKLIVEFEQISLPVINLRELILSKINTGRKKDEADIEELQKIQSKINAKK